MANQTFTSGQILTATQMTTLQSNSALQLITPQTAFTTVASVSLAANSFTSTYRNYKIMFQLSSASTITTITSRLRAAGTDSTTAAYNQMSVGLTQLGTASNQTDSNATTWTISAAGSAGVWALEIDVLDPLTAKETQIQGQLSADNGATFVGRTVNGIFNGVTSFDSMSFIASTGTITGNYAVYGYNK